MTRYGVVGVSEFVKVRTTSVIILKREKKRLEPLKSLPFLFDLRLLLRLNLHFTWLFGVPEARVLLPRTDAITRAVSRPVQFGEACEVVSVKLLPQFSLSAQFKTTTSLSLNRVFFTSLCTFWKEQLLMLDLRMQKDYHRKSCNFAPCPQHNIWSTAWQFALSSLAREGVM